MSQAITTTYIGPSNTRSSRIRATAWGGRVTVAYDSALNSEDNHRRAAQALCEKIGWPCTGWVAGSSADEQGYHFVFIYSDMTL